MSNINNGNINISEFFCENMDNLYSLTELLQFFNLEDNNVNRRLLSKKAKEEGFESKTPQKKGYKRELHFMISLKPDNEEEKEEEKQTEQNKNKIIILPYQYKTDEKSEPTDFYLMKCLSLKYSRKIILSKVDKNGISTKFGYLKIIGYIEHNNLKYIEPYFNEERKSELPEKFQKLIMSEDEIRDHSLFSWENDKVFLNKRFLNEFEEGFLERFEKEELKAEEKLKEKQFYIKRLDGEDISEYLERYEREIGEVKRFIQEKEEKERDLAEKRKREFEKEEQKRETNRVKEYEDVQKYFIDCEIRTKLLKTIEKRDISVNELEKIATDNNLNLDWADRNTTKAQIKDYILSNIQPVKLG